MITVASFARTVACSKLQDSGEKSFSKKVKKKKQETRGGFRKSRASYFRSTLSNTSPLRYLRAWHRLRELWRS